MRKITLFYILALVAVALSTRPHVTVMDDPAHELKIKVFKETLNSIGDLLLRYVPSWLNPPASMNVDPDIYLTPIDMIQHKGYPVEVHNVTSEDGYYLTAWRMRKNVTRKYPVILQHGLLDCSFSWVVNEANESLPYLLVDAGYDVWLTNNRGNRYSRGHVGGDTYDQYWAFSWDEMAKYDVPAFTDYIKANTSINKVHYIGHSQGTTQWFGHMSTNLSKQADYQSFIGMGPVLFIKDVGGLLDHPFVEKVLIYLFQKLDIGELLVVGSNDIPILGDVCSYAESLCEGIIQTIAGHTKNENYNVTRMPVIAAHEPGGASLQTMNHWIQMIGSTEFVFYDYGTSVNLEKYGQPIPPPYQIENLKNLEIPIFLVQGTCDVLSDTTDYDALIANLPNADVKHMVVQDWGHLDYLWAYDATDKLYSQVFPFLEKADAN